MESLPFGHVRCDAPHFDDDLVLPAIDFAEGCAAGVSADAIDKLCQIRDGAAGE